MSFIDFIIPLDKQTQKHMETIDILDVTVIEPRFKHPTIFNKFDQLEPGHAFVIHNDHDPKPLYYQLLGERGNIFQWEYLEEGPENWKVKISKNGADNVPTIGDIAAKDYRKAEVFKKLGIDFCCGGKKTTKEACEEVGITEAYLEAELLKVESSNKASQDFNKWDLDFLADYIINTHHRYVSENVEIISGLAQKVAGQHGTSAPEALEVAHVFENMAKELLEHMKKEEEMLFPYIKKLVALKKQGGKIMQSPFGSVQNPITMMENEHEAAGEDFRLIRQATQDYVLPKDACNSFMYLYEKLKEFEDDLHQHIHLENNILFPKAQKLEKELLG